MREEIRKQTAIQHSLLAFSHSHSSVALGPRGRTTVHGDKDSKWNDATLDTILVIVKKSKERAE